MNEVRVEVVPVPASSGHEAAQASATTATGAFTLSIRTGGSHSRPATYTISAACITSSGDATVARGTIPHFEAASRGRILPGVDSHDITATIDGHQYKATVVHATVRDGCEVTVFPAAPLQKGANGAAAGSRTSYRLLLPAHKVGGGGSRSGAATVITPMPGKVVKVMAQIGDAVAAGTPLLILEAMKMEHVIKAPVDGVVATLAYKPGDFVDDGRELVTFKPAGAAGGGKK